MNSEEMVNSLFERRDFYIAEQKRRRTVRVRTTTYLCCVCFMAVLSFGIDRVGFFNIQDPSPTISTGDDTTMTNPSNGDLIDVPNYVIIWGDNDDLIYIPISIDQSLFKRQKDYHLSCECIKELSRKQQNCNYSISGDCR